MRRHTPAAVEYAVCLSDQRDVLRELHNRNSNIIMDVRRSCVFAILCIFDPVCFQCFKTAMVANELDELI